MIKVTFEYRDRWTNEKWRKQTCIVSSLRECKRVYGLGIDPDCEYRIIEVKELGEGEE